MIPRTLGWIAHAIGGTVEGGPSDATATQLADTVVDGPVIFNSREAVPGSLFFALPGETADGTRFAASAVAAGAVAVVAGPDGIYRQPWIPADDVPRIRVADPLKALAAFATAHIAALPKVTVVGLTGSAGKTTTKDLIGRLLKELAPTIAPVGSFNNELGFPLTVLRTEESTRYLVAEMGARGRGHIAELCRIAPPRLGLVLNVGTAHIGEFGSPEGIAAAKGELVEALPAKGNCNPDQDGVALLNADDPRVRAMASRTSARVVTFGEAGDADVRADDVQVGPDGRASFTLLYRDQDGPHRVPVALRLVGEHHVSNALGAAAVALELGLSGAKVAEVLSNAEPDSRWRMEVRETPDGVTVVNDAYNANPDSVRAALKTLATMARARPGSRSWAVLGEMKEIGTAAESAVEHDAIGRLAVRLNVSQTVAVGAGAAAIHSGASMEGSYDGESAAVADGDAALVLLRDPVTGVRPGDVVLVKASRTVGLESIAAALLEAPDPASANLPSSEPARSDAQ